MGRFDPVVWGVGFNSSFEKSSENFGQLEWGWRKGWGVFLKGNKNKVGLGKGLRGSGREEWEGSGVVTSLTCTPLCLGGRKGVGGVVGQ